jgi:hypothetical protein
MKWPDMLFPYTLDWKTSLAPAERVESCTTKTAVVRHRHPLSLLQRGPQVRPFPDPGPIKNGLFIMQSRTTQINVTQTRWVPSVPRCIAASVGTIKEQYGNNKDSDALFCALLCPQKMC